MPNNIEVCFSPALFPFYPSDNSIVIIVDIFRATTSICTAFQNGLKSVKTVADIEEARLFKSKGFLVAAERNVQKVDFADFGNSPFDFTKENVQEKELIFTTTNGTQAVEAALHTDEIVIGSFSNFSTLCNYCMSRSKNIFILCSGWNNRFCIEDTLFAGAITQKLLESNLFQFHSDAVREALHLWKNNQNDLMTCIAQTEHYERLLRNGLQNSIPYCLEMDTCPVLPKYNKTKNHFELENI